VIELAGHSNIIAIKESSGNLDKVKQMVEATRQVKREATVTETFEAVTPRMIRPRPPNPKNRAGNGSVASLVGTAEFVERRRPRPSTKAKAALKSPHLQP